MKKIQNKIKNRYSKMKNRYYKIQIKKMIKYNKINKKFKKI